MEEGGHSDVWAAEKASLPEGLETFSSVQNTEGCPLRFLEIIIME